MAMLSNAEQALRRSSNLNAPLKCWGCQGIYPDDNHLYRDCTKKAEQRVRDNYKGNLDDFLARRKNSSRFDPNYYKRDGFKTKKATMLFNSIVGRQMQPRGNRLSKPL